MKTQCAIIGGGVAGLCAAIRLSELGKESLVIEGGCYPSQKVCGEFLSPECINFLHQWNIFPILLNKVVMKTSKKTLEFSFPSPAGALSHLQLDPILANRAITLGAKIKTETLVNSLQPKRFPHHSHVIHLSNGEIVEASQLIIATGRVPNHTKKKPQFFMGFKAHFKNIPLNHQLEMFSLPGAYLGIAPIEEQKYNVACLAAIKSVKKYQTPQKFIENLMTQNQSFLAPLFQGENLFSEWLTASLPNFGIKQTPDWDDCYFIGDAAVSVPPACGNGLCLAILGGRLAAEYLVLRQAQLFKKMWVKKCTSQMIWDKFLHYTMLHPSFFNPLIQTANLFPSLTKKMFFLTRQN